MLYCTNQYLPPFLLEVWHSGTVVVSALYLSHSFSSIYCLSPMLFISLPDTIFLSPACIYLSPIHYLFPMLFIFPPCYLSLSLLFTISPPCYLPLSHLLSLPYAIYLSPVLFISLSPIHYNPPLLFTSLPFTISPPCYLSCSLSLFPSTLPLCTSYSSPLAIFHPLTLYVLSFLLSMFLTLALYVLSFLLSIFHLSSLCLLSSLFSLSLPHISLPSLRICLSFCVCLSVCRSIGFTLSLYHVFPSPPHTLPSLCTHFL